MAAEYDLCRHLASRPADIFVAARRDGQRGAYAIGDGDATTPFAIGAKLGKGAYGTVYRGTFGAGRDAIAIKVNNPKAVAREVDDREVRMQAKLHCHLRAARERAKVTGRIALVPATFFAADAPGLGRAVGMEAVDRTLLAHLTQRLKAEPKQIDYLHRTALRDVAALLQRLQADLRFVHGDLHAENVMVRDAPPSVYVIDFGMGSAAKALGAGGSRRETTDERYEGVPFRASLDLLTLLTSLHDDLVLAKAPRAAGWCFEFVRPFWAEVRHGMAADRVPSKLRYNAQHTAHAARAEWEDSGEIYYAHHVLYEHFARVDYPPCEPGNFLRALAAATPGAGEASGGRIFGDL